MKKTDSMLLATFFSTCFYSATYPYIYKVIMSAVTENAIAVNQIVRLHQRDFVFLAYGIDSQTGCIRFSGFFVCWKALQEFVHLFM